jgi:hypothetical protein
VQIGPPNPRLLPSKDKSTWDPKDVADCILADRSTLVLISLFFGFLSQNLCDLKRRKNLLERKL